MQKLVVVRHGLYNSTGSLSTIGVEQARLLARKMAVAFAGQKVVIYTSHQTRTRETAKIISDAFGNALVEEHTRLSSWEGDLPQKQKQDILELVESGAGKCDVMILVTHMEVIDLFPTFWGLRRGVVIREMMDTPKGTARVFDAESGREEPLMHF